jgi:hypothetical protein
LGTSAPIRILRRLSSVSRTTSPVCPRICMSATDSAPKRATTPQFGPLLTLRGSDPLAPTPRRCSGAPNAAVLRRPYSFSGCGLPGQEPVVR